MLGKQRLKIILRGEARDLHRHEGVCVGQHKDAGFGIHDVTPDSLPRCDNRPLARRLAVSTRSLSSPW